MKSIKGSLFITISSGEQNSFIKACDMLSQKANVVKGQLNVIMPCKLIKVEVISFTNATEPEKTIWLATGLMKKCDMSRQ
jgi:F420-0:gamma-glutamyl ligase